MFLKFIVRALKYRRQRLLLSFAALAIAATLATVLFGIYGTIEQRFREEFRGYGANLVAVPANGDTLPLGIVTAARKLGAQAAPFLITSVRAGNRTIAIAGFIPKETVSMTSYWHVIGSRDPKSGECIAGASIARALNRTIASRIELPGLSCTLTGIVSTGGVEDEELLIPFEAAATLAGVRDVASLVEIHAAGSQAEAVRASLAAAYPSADVRTVRSVTGTESSVVLKIRATLFLLTLLILAITTLCVSSNFTEMVIERSKEIGILKALGGAERRIAAFFVSESAALAFAAAITGYVVGSFTAAAIGRQIFGGAFHLDSSWLVFIAVAAVMLGVAAIATVIATSRIWGIQPAIILRGE